MHVVAVVVLIDYHVRDYGNAVVEAEEVVKIEQDVIAAGITVAEKRKVGKEKIELD